MTDSVPHVITLTGEQLAIVRDLVADKIAQDKIKLDWYKGGPFRAQVQETLDELRDLQRHLASVP